MPIRPHKAQSRADLRDLEAPARRAIRRATGGRVHYKISPMLQIIFARVLEERHPALYGQLRDYYRLDPAAWAG